MVKVNTRLTNARLNAALKIGRPTWLSDDESVRNRGRLVARISNASAPLYYFRYSIDGKQKYISLGIHSEKLRDGYLTLEEARKEAHRLSELYRDPFTRDVRSTLKQQVPASPVASVQIAPIASPPLQNAHSSIWALCELYIAQMKIDQKASWPDVQRLFTREISNHSIAEKPAQSVTSDEIIEVLRPIVKRASRQAAKLRSYLGAAFECAIRARLDAQASPEWKRFSITNNPIRAIAKIGSTSTRDRNLNGREVGLLWCHLTLSDNSQSIAYRFLRINLLAGGQRCKQLLRCKLTDVDDYEKTLIQFDGKGKKKQPRKHVIPASALLWNEIEQLFPIAAASNCKYLFPGRAIGKPVAPDSISKTTVVISKELASLKFEGFGVPPFTYLDLRRTTETRMADLGVSREIRQQILSHGLSGIQHEHYDRSTYLIQKREALDKWQAYVLQMADEQRDKYIRAAKAK